MKNLICQEFIIENEKMPILLYRAGTTYKDIRTRPNHIVGMITGFKLTGLLTGYLKKNHNRLIILKNRLTYFALIR